VSGETTEILFRRLPSIGKLLNQPEFRELVCEFSRELVVRSATGILDQIRSELSSGELGLSKLEARLAGLSGQIRAQLDASLSPSLRPVINGTGVVVFTNAGRAPIQESVIHELASTAGRYSNLEYDLESGGRGHRDIHFESRVVRLLGCEAATVCNNAAAALLLILNTLASGRKVLVSRGELIEIGGSFRLPSIMEKSGAVLREVGTTNKTRGRDYAEAIDDETALILRVHPSNYQIVGYALRPALDELVEIAQSRGIPLVHDAGSGYLFPTGHPALAREPVIAESLKAGSDIVCFSGDKLMGGPQAGLIVGRKKLIEQVRRNPLMRAMRVDKLIYSALELTLKEYELGRFQETIPVWKFLSLPVDQVRRRAEQLALNCAVPGLEIELADGFSLAGGGSAPDEQIPTCLIALHSDKLSANEIELRLRRFRVPILCRIEEDRVLIDLRTVFPDQDELIREALRTLDASRE
jgi:L-seryl-tRNA(Ser) seleniumtransferase